MRRTRILSIIIFIVVTALFIFYRMKEFTIEDNNGPVITMDQETLEVPCSATKEEMLAGIRAEDRTDGDVSDTLIIETMGNFIEPGRREITVAAFDSDNHASKAERQIVYTDYHSPQFSIEAPLSFPIDSENIMEAVTAQDVLDGDISGNIKASSENGIDLMTEGSYEAVFSVANSAGDVSSLPVTIRIYDPADQNGKPTIELSQYIVYTGVGVPINPWDYIEKVTMSGIDFERADDGILYDDNPSANQLITAVGPDQVGISSEGVDYNTPGTYEVTYQITDANEQTGSVVLIVVVA